MFQLFLSETVDYLSNSGKKWNVFTRNIEILVKPSRHYIFIASLLYLISFMSVQFASIQCGIKSFNERKRLTVCKNLVSHQYMSHCIVCSKLKTSWKSDVNKVGKNSRYFVGVFNKTIIPPALLFIYFLTVGYKMISIAKSAQRASIHNSSSDIKSGSEETHGGWFKNVCGMVNSRLCPVRIRVK